MEQSQCWGTNSHSVSREITRILLNPKVYPCVHKNQSNWFISLIRIIQPKNSDSVSSKFVHAILLPTPERSKWPFRFRFSDKILVYVSDLLSVCCMPRLSRPPPFDDPNNSYSVRRAKCKYKNMDAITDSFTHFNWT